MNSGEVQGPVRVWLRLEGLVAFGLATYFYANEGGSWLLFGALFFVPDISFAGYLAGPRVGATIYNAAHSYVGPPSVQVRFLFREEPGCYSRWCGQRTSRSTARWDMG